MAALPVLISGAQGKQNINDCRKTSSGYIGRKHRWNYRTLEWSGLQIQQTGVADLVDVVTGFMHTRAALAVA